MQSAADMQFICMDDTDPRHPAAMYYHVIMMQPTEAYNI